MNIQKTFIFFMGFLLIAFPAHAGKEIRILCSIYPILQITRHVIEGRDGVTLQILLPAGLGCPHDYALTPQDMHKLAGADVLIVNGLGMEEFLGSAVARANPRLTVIDSSAGIEDLLPTIVSSEDHEKNDYHATHDEHGHGNERGEQRGKHSEHEHAGMNPHLFASPSMVAKLAMIIAGGLSKFDPSGTDIYFANAGKYADSMQRLANDFSHLSKRLKTNRIVTQHEVFGYLARDMGLDVVAVLQTHPGQELSAAEMLEFVDIIKEKKVGAVFTEPQYPAGIGQTIAREAGIVAGILDPVAGGPADVPLDYYESVMRRNMQILEKTLGSK